MVPSGRPLPSPYHLPAVPPARKRPDGPQRPSLPRSFLAVALGPGAVTATPGGHLRLNPQAFQAQLHTAHWDKRITCRCSRCKQPRNPTPARAHPRQPWEAHAA